VIDGEEEKVRELVQQATSEDVSAEVILNEGLIAGINVDIKPLDLKKTRENGTKVVGYVPNGYVPLELIYACGAVPVAIAKGGDSEPLAASASYLGRFLDPFCRAQIGYRLLQKEPLYEMIDLLIVPITDMHIRGIADSWDFFSNVEVFSFPVPHAKTNHGFQHYLEGINLVKERLERLTGTEITMEGLREEIELTNKIRVLLKEISLMRRLEHPPITGKDFVRLIHSSFYADRFILKEALESFRDEIKMEATPSVKKPRVLLTGSTLAAGDYKVIDLLEEAGASVVIEEFCEGLTDYWQTVDMDGDLMHALATNYFTKRIPGAFFRGAANERFDFLLKLAKDFKVNGIVWYSLMHREVYDIEGYLFHEMAGKRGLPMLKIISNYDASETGAIRTRIETFIETIKAR